MKKIYNIAAALLISSTVYGQWVTPQPVPAFNTVDIEGEYLKQLEAKKESQLKRISSKDPIVNARVSHFDERFAAAPSPLTGFTMPLFPDSVPQEMFSNTTAFQGVQIHAIGGVFDPTSEDFQLINSAVAARDPYTVDTLWINYLYKIVNPGNVDTLRVQMFVTDTTDTSPALNTLSIATGQGLPHEGEPVKGIRFASNMNHGVQATSVAPGIVTYDYILGPGDTSSTTDYLAIPCGTGGNGMDVPAGGLFGWFAFFVPGNTAYNSSDVYFDAQGSTETLNNFRSFGFQEDPNANDLFAYDPTSYGSSHTLFNDGRYQIAATAFLNNTMPPGLSSANIVDYTYSAPNSSVGISEIEKTNAILGNAYPNPFKDVTRIRYTLANNSNVQFEVTDITGKVVMQMNEGSKSAGTYNIDLAADNFNSGVYYYSIITDTEKVTKKMIVVE